MIAILTEAIKKVDVEAQDLLPVANAKLNIVIDALKANMAVHAESRRNWERQRK
jgi:hypothetical protein